MANLSLTIACRRQSAARKPSSSRTWRGGTWASMAPDVRAPWLSAASKSSREKWRKSWEGWRYRRTWLSATTCRRSAKRSCETMKPTVFFSPPNSNNRKAIITHTWSGSDIRGGWSAATEPIPVRRPAAAGVRANESTPWHWSGRTRLRETREPPCEVNRWPDSWIRQQSLPAIAMPEWNPLDWYYEPDYRHRCSPRLKPWAKCWAQSSYRSTGVLRIERYPKSSSKKQ